ncbi:alkaline phosphatase [Asticcacaulis machinosus]|uniref:Alkaline phosphatase n=1 Tax=Asticcacaulis machinosus TaxID=2984211 RepID=A0ABT5HM11_9CAUL|nr:alkaline phosphatase [Asticcacaulis machinosus]MDC7677186.1 alkaline phosphatase [Asticcacaulis machinosus]
MKAALCLATALMTTPVWAQTSPYPALDAALARTPNTAKAKNIILFIGDGMGINSVTAGRIMAGQARGLDGASYRLAFESLPYSAFSKTYSADKFVTDSANGISAITTGIKTINGAIGVDATVTSKACAPKAAHIPTIAEQARRMGKAAGVVTTSGLTDATPAGAYGHVSTRGWRSDTELPADAAKAGCIDIARQLVEAPEAIRMDVVLGGDLARFQTADKGGKRKDKDLIRLWAAQKGAKVVTGKSALNAVDPKTTSKLLGLFSEGDLPSVVDHKNQTEVPNLADMTAKAIDILSQDPDGFFLLVESAAIDKWHHQNNAYRALTDVDELDKAVQVALSKTDAKDTLIIVTADHSHGLTQSAGSTREEPIMGLARNRGVNEPDKNGKGRTVLSYASGPSALEPHDHDLTQDEVLQPDFKQPTLVPLSSAQHTGEDVPVYASGPQAHLVSGTVESTLLYEVMRYAISIKP